jgi:YVTN family beta-propeller protein
MQMLRHRPSLVASLVITFATTFGNTCSDGLADETKQEKVTIRPVGKEQVGPSSDGRIVVPTNQVLQPAGKQVMFPGRPNDIALSPDGRYLAVLSRNEVLTINVETGAIVSTAKIGGASYKGIVFTPDGQQLLVSTSASKKAATKEGVIARFLMDADGELKPGESIALQRLAPSDSEKQADAASKNTELSADGVTHFGAHELPAGMAFSADGKSVYVAVNLTNRLVEVDLAANRVIREFSVGNAPYDVVRVGDKVYVSNFAGRIPLKGDVRGAAGRGPVVKVDPIRNIASDGTVSVVDLKTGAVTREIVVGLHPSSIAVTPDGRFVIVTRSA